MRTFEITIAVLDNDGEPGLTCKVSVEAPNRRVEAGEAFARKTAKVCALMWGVDQVHAELVVVDIERNVEQRLNVPVRADG